MKPNSTKIIELNKTNLWKTMKRLKTNLMMTTMMTKKCQMILTTKRKFKCFTRIDSAVLSTFGELQDIHKIMPVRKRNL